MVEEAGEAIWVADEAPGVEAGGERGTREVLVHQKSALLTKDAAMDMSGIVLKDDQEEGAIRMEAGQNQREGGMGSQREGDVSCGIRTHPAREEKPNRLRRATGICQQRAE